MIRYGTATYLAGLLVLFIAQSAIANDRELEIFHSCERIPNQITSSFSNSKNTVKVDSDVDPIKQINSDTATTQASFWWAIKQFDPFEGKLVQNWFTNPKKQEIDLIVNWQLWKVLDYLERYRFVNQFGTVARKYGYNLKIFNQKEQCLATYQFNSISNPPKWELYLEKLGEDSLQIKTPVQLQQEES